MASAYTAHLKGASVVASRSIETQGITNSVPKRLARVMPSYLKSTTLGRPGSIDVFVTAADDIYGMNAQLIAKKLTIPYETTGYLVIEFETPISGLASPIFRSNPGFVGFGKTLGRAREFVIPNQAIPLGSTIRIVK